MAARRSTGRDRDHLRSVGSDNGLRVAPDLYVGSAIKSFRSDSGSWECVPFAWRGKMSTTSLRLSGVPSTAVTRNSVDPKLISFALGCPALEHFPAEEYQRIARSILCRRSYDAMGLGAVTGQPALRHAIAREHLRYLPTKYWWLRDHSKGWISWL